MIVDGVVCPRDLHRGHGLPLLAVLGHGDDVL